MKKSEKYLSLLLLLLIGVLIGMISMLFRQGSFKFDLAEVKVTEINRSTSPLFTPEQLEQIDDRFLFRSVARNVTPTVVYIETTVSNRNMGTSMQDGEESLWDRFLPPRARTVGSGVLISQDGYILTNNHVIQDAVRDGITVTLDDKRLLDARVVGGDPSTDLAVLKIDAEDLPAAVIGNSDLVEVGDWVMAIGNPFRLRSTVTAGIVGALSREVEIINDQYRIESFIQTDAAINRGNSGGALVNTSGEVIGINTAIATQSGTYQGYGFAVPSNLALKVARDIIEFGEVKRGLMGVSIQTVDAGTARRIGLDRIAGVLVSGIGTDSAAEEAEMRPDDVILAVNGSPVNEANLLQERVAMFRPGDEITLTLWRRGREFDQPLRLRERVIAPPVAARVQEFQEEEVDGWNEIPEDGRNSGVEEFFFEEPGFMLRALARPENPSEFNIYIQRVQRGSEAWNRGLRPGSELLELNGEEFRSLREIRREITESIRRNKSLMLKIQTEEGTVGYFRLY